MTTLHQLLRSLGAAGAVRNARTACERRADEARAVDRLEATLTPSLPAAVTAVDTAA